MPIDDTTAEKLEAQDDLEYNANPDWFCCLCGRLRDDPNCRCEEAKV